MKYIVFNLLNERVRQGDPDGWDWLADDSDDAHADNGAELFDDFDAFDGEDEVYDVEAVLRVLEANATFADLPPWSAWPRKPVPKLPN